MRGAHGVRLALSRGARREAGNTVSRYCTATSLTAFYAASQQCL